MAQSRESANSSNQLNLTESSYQGLRAQIIDGTLPQGSVLTERRIAGVIGVSRTPLRAALVRLEGEGLVERLPNGAVMIRRFYIEDLLQILTVRRALEGEAAALATGRMNTRLAATLAADAARFANAQDVALEKFWQHDDAFHDSIAEANGEPLLQDMIMDLRRKARMCHAPRMPSNFVNQAKEHIRILKALAGDDPERSRREMHTHLHAVRLRLVNWLTGAVNA
ncbi:GntR family transcriptional regulator [Pikeienuella piscinae]|uniref:GntR family transcriptional regulator n=1 Tax=Pikeienuella piscinae TaxID=2748098 RepID=A0A7L5C3Y6_9RHOB|nr:GntR family transcriptional regulator [Pikeienuella piscinae]QIE56629.1 GntR family transcriptional regulator [Pikeienuella piscinae]